MRGLQTTLRSVRQELSRFASESFDATLGADVASFDAAILNAKRKGAAFASENFEASVGIRGSAESVGELKAVDTEADRVDGRDVTVDVNTDESGIRSLSDSFKGLASNIRATGTVLAAAAIPFSIAALGAGIPTIAALAASVGGLTVALGSGLVGAAVAAGAALGGLAGAFGLVAVPVTQLLTNLKDYDASLDSVKSAETTAKAAAQSRADALRRLSDAQANVAATAKDSRQAVAEQEEALRRTRTDAASAIQAAERSLADARTSGAQGVREAEASLAQTRNSGAQAIADQERKLQQVRSDAARAISDQERQLAQTRAQAASDIAAQERSLQETRASASEANAQAEGELESARDSLSSSTRSLVAAQNELNRALQTEPLNQAQATLDLASARDRASDALRAYNEAVAQSGRNSEEATDARRDLEQANLDLKQTEIDVRDTRKHGSDELQSARAAAKSAADDQRSAAEGVRQAEQGVVDTRAEGVKQIAEQQRALRQTAEDARAQIAEQQRALKQTRGDSQGQIAEQQRALRQTREDNARQIAEQQRALAEARAENIRGEREAMREVVDVRRSAAQDIQDAEKSVADTARDGAQRVADAQDLVADAQRAATQSAQAATRAQTDLRKETVKLEPAQKALFNEYKRFQHLAQQAFRPAQNAAADLGVSILRLAESYLPRLGKASTATIGALSRSFSTFRAELSRPVEQAGITRYLKLIPGLTEEAATAAGKLALALFNVFGQSLKFALPLTRAIGDMADQFLRFTESAEGRREIATFFQNSVDMALRLLPIVRNLAEGFVNLIGALNRTGIVDQAVRGFGSLAQSFADSTREGGGLDAFLRDARGLMPFIARAAKDVGGAILGIASAAIGAREHGSKLTILQQIFQGISRAAGPLQSLVVGTFRQLGPVIARILPPLSRFFATFAGSSGPLVAFLNIITGMLKAFNNLPDGVKRTIAQLAALKLILGGLGVGQVIAPMGRFASNMLLARGAAARLAGKSVLPAVVGSVGRLGLLLGAGGAVVAGVGLLAAGFVHAYRTNKNFHESVDHLVDSLKDLGGDVTAPVKKFLLNLADEWTPKATKAVEGLAKSIEGVFDANSAGPGAASTQSIHQLGAKQLSSKSLTVGKDLASPWEEAGTKLGAALVSGLRAVLGLKAGGGATGSGPLFALGQASSGSFVAGFRKGMGEQKAKPFDLSKVQWFTFEWHPKEAKIGPLVAGIVKWLWKQFGIELQTLGGLKPILDFVNHKVNGWFKKAFQQLGWKGVGLNILNGILGAIPGGQFVGRLISKLANAAREGHWFKVGKPIVQGILNSLKDIPGVGPPMAALLNAILKWWGITSPSTKAANKIGKPIMLGVLKGIRDAPIIGPVIKIFELLFGRSKTKTDSQKWKPLGGGIMHRFVEGVKGLPIVGPMITKLENFFGKSKEKTDSQPWKPLGSGIVQKIIAGIKQIPIIGPFVTKLQNVAGALTKHEFGFWDFGKHIIQAIINGAQGVNLGNPVVAIVQAAEKALVAHNQAHSPARRWIPHGKNIALGIAQGIRDGGPAMSKALQDGMAGLDKIRQRQMEALQTQAKAATMSGDRGAVLQIRHRAEELNAHYRQAQSPTSPGGKSITKEEMRQIMRETHVEGAKAQGKSIYAAAVAAGLDPQTLKRLWAMLDGGMSKDFNFRTNMLADAR